jgi:oligopeptide transport system substrate-binding protein
MSIDRRDVVAILKAGQIPANHLVPPGLPGYIPAEGPDFDPAAAAALLAEAGFPGGEGFPPLRLLYNTLESHKLVAAIVQDQWKRHLGIEVELENREWKTYLKAVDALDYDVARAGWIGDYLDPNTFLDLWVTGGGNNRTGWGEPEYDQLILDAATEPDPVVRATILAEAEALLNEQMPIIPIYWYVWTEVLQPSVRGHHANLLDQHPLSSVWLER